VIAEDIGRGVMRLCGDVEDEEGEETWRVDLERMVREVGRGMLALESVCLSSIPFQNSDWDRDLNVESEERNAG
jgi:hypothetical protein